MSASHGDGTRTGKNTRLPMFVYVCMYVCMYVPGTRESRQEFRGGVWGEKGGLVGHLHAARDPRNGVQPFLRSRVGG